MLSYFPKYYTDKAMYVYIALLVCVPVIFGYPMEWYFGIFGIVEVVGFFYFANQLPKKWVHYSPKTFTKELFKTALVIRIIYVLLSYWFYNLMTDQPFEFGAADVLFYDNIGKFGHYCISNNIFNFIEKFQWYADVELSDCGYPIYLAFVYYIFDDSILAVRLLNSLWSAITCILIYKLVCRNFGEGVGRLAAILCMLMPNLIYYCGLHLKETVMLFLTVLSIERIDKSMKCKNIEWFALIIAVVTMLLLFMFRTALAAVVLFSFILTIFSSPRKFFPIYHKVAIGLFFIVILYFTVGNVVVDEINHAIIKNENAQDKSYEWRTKRKNGNEFAKYAGAAVFAPLIFTIPFPTMVETPTQEELRMINGGNFVKNITSVFTIIALFTLFFSGKWREHILIISYTCGYLAVITVSSFAHSERFHLPALPFSLIFAALGISCLQNKHKKWFNYWIMFIFVANIAWTWFKLKGRGM